MQTGTYNNTTTTTTTTNNGNNTNNTNNNHNVSAIWRILIILLFLFVLLCLILIHIAYYIYVRNMGNNGLNAGYTGWSASTPSLFFDGTAEFIPLGFILLPLVLLSIAFLGRWFDLASCVVALVFAVIDFVVILFGTVGVIVVHHLNHNNPNNSNNNTNTGNTTTTHSFYNTTTNTTQYYNTTAPNNNNNNNNNNYCHSNVVGVFPNAFCNAQAVLVAGMVALLFAELLVLILATRAVRQAKRAWLANTAQYNNQYQYNNTGYTTGAVYPVTQTTETVVQRTL